MTTVPAATRSNAVRGLRANSFAATVMLLIEYGLGIWVNLYARLPVSDTGAGIPAGFVRAIAHGPVGLSVHATVGVVLLVAAVAAVVRSVLGHRPTLISLAALGLVAIVVAATSRSSFVGAHRDAASLVMAITAGIAVGAYALVLFILPASQPGPTQS